MKSQSGLKFIVGLITFQLAISIVLFSFISNNTSFVDNSKIKIKPEKLSVEDYYKSLSQEGSLKLLVGKNEYVINYRDIELKFNTAKYDGVLFKDKSQNENVSAGINENNLYKMLQIISENEEMPSTDAYVDVREDKVIIVEEQKGERINIDKLYSFILDYLIKNAENPLIIDVYKENYVDTFDVEISSEFFDGIEKIVSTKRIRVENTIEKDILEKAASLINNRMLLPKEEFSLRKDLLRDGLSITNDNEKAISKLASGLNYVLLSSGNIAIVNLVDINEPVDYIEKGLEVIIKDTDYKVKNIGNERLMIKYSIIEDDMVFYLLGSNQMKNYSLKTDVIQELMPPRIIKHNPSLQDEETVVVEKGEKGLVVELYLAGSNNEKVKLFLRRYEPQPEVIESGKMSKKEGINK